MVHIETRRAGPIVIAVYVNDHDGGVTCAWGFTTAGALRRVLRRLD